MLTDPHGREQRVPALGAWRASQLVRYATPAPSRYTYRTMLSDPANPELPGQIGSIVVPTRIRVDLVNGVPRFMCML